MTTETIEAENQLAGFSTLEQTAKKLKRTKRTLQRWNSLGIGPPQIKIGRLILFCDESVADWLKANERGGRRGR